MLQCTPFLAFCFQLVVLVSNAILFIGSKALLHVQMNVPFSLEASLILKIQKWLNSFLRHSHSSLTLVTRLCRKKSSGYQGYPVWKLRYHCEEHRVWNLTEHSGFPYNPIIFEQFHFVAEMLLVVSLNAGRSWKEWRGILSRCTTMLGGSKGEETTILICMSVRSLVQFF